MKRVLVLGCCLTILASGCVFPTDTSPVVGVSIEDVTEEQRDGSVAFSGSLEVLDHYSDDFLIEDVRVEFVDEADSVMKTLEVGPIRNTSFKAEISTELAHPPRRVLIRTGKIRTGADVDIHQLRRDDDGNLEYFYADEE